jgi:hypothetical protein
MDEIMNDLDEQKEYEGRADYIDDADLIKWTIENSHFDALQKKLCNREAVLIAGPRGSGKTHHMRYVYAKCLKNQTYPLAIYVTYGKYYHLEPLLYKESNAINLFHAWVLGKLLLGIYQLLKDKGEEDFSVIDDAFGPEQDLAQFVSLLEIGLKDDNHDQWMRKITIQRVANLLESIASKLDRNRVILLMDDAYSGLACQDHYTI